jgi:hypothetical protein
MAIAIIARKDGEQVRIWARNQRLFEGIHTHARRHSGATRKECGD